MLRVLFLATGAYAHCQIFNNMFGHWNVLVEGDMTLARSDIEGRTFVGGTANLVNFAIGQKLGYQCTKDYVLSAAKVIGNSGNFCGGKVATTNAQLTLVGSNTNCNRGNTKNCEKVVPIPFFNVGLNVFQVRLLIL